PPVEPDYRSDHHDRHAAGLADDRRADPGVPRAVSHRRGGRGTGVTPLNCPQCGTELAPDVLDCPSCAALVHAETLKRLAADAEAAARAGHLIAARTHWSEALALLPRHSQQHVAVGQRIDALTRQIDATPSAGAPA